MSANILESSYFFTCLAILKHAYVQCKGQPMRLTWTNHSLGDGHSGSPQSWRAQAVPMMADTGIMRSRDKVPCLRAPIIAADDEDVPVRCAT